MFWSTRKIIISTGHELHHPHYAHFYCYFSHRLGIERVKTYMTEAHCPVEYSGTPPVSLKTETGEGIHFLLNLEILSTCS